MFRWHIFKKLFLQTTMSSQRSSFLQSPQFHLQPGSRQISLCRRLNRIRSKYSGHRNPQIKIMSLILKMISHVGQKKLNSSVFYIHLCTNGEFASAPRVEMWKKNKKPIFPGCIFLWRKPCLFTTLPSEFISTFTDLASIMTRGSIFGVIKERC